jgi:hypothetical protein
VFDSGFKLRLPSGGVCSALEPVSELGLRFILLRIQSLRLTPSRSPDIRSPSVRNDAFRNFIIAVSPTSEFTRVPAAMHSDLNSIALAEQIMILGRGCGW